MSNKELVIKLKEYIEEQEIDIDYDIDKEKFRDLKLDYLAFSKEFIKLFNEFRKDFKNFKKAQDLIVIQQKHSLFLNNLVSSYNKDVYIGKNEILNTLENYIGTHYYEIVDFVDLTMEIYE